MSGISSISGSGDLQSLLINSATSMKASQTGLAIGTAIMKQTMDQTEAMGEAIVEMINETPTASDTGGLVDIKI